MSKGLVSILLFLSFIFSQVLANSCNKEGDMKATSQKILSCLKPECFANEGFQDKIKTPEEVLKNKMKNISSEEAIYRLIFSEMLASNCVESLSDKELAQMAMGIASVINKRVADKKTRDEKEIVFAKAQFRSSTGGCDVAKRAEFLCPSSYTKWEKLWKLAENSWKKIQKNDPLGKQAVFYYFPKHFEKSVDCSKFNSPEVFENWKKGKTEVTFVGQSKDFSMCARFFK